MPFSATRTRLNPSPRMAGFDSPEPTLMACTPGRRLSVCMSDPLKFCSINCLLTSATGSAERICTALLLLPLTTTSFRDTPSLSVWRALSLAASPRTESSGSEKAAPLAADAWQKLMKSGSTAAASFLFLILNVLIISLTSHGIARP